jgi:hypothetical protein
LDAFLTVLWIFLFVIWIWILITVLIDLFRSRDLSGLAKALWFLFILFLPLLGVLVYLIARGTSMHERQVQQATQLQDQYDAYIKSVATSGQPSAADELQKLATLRDQGVITDDEFNAQKAKLLSSQPSA